MARPRKAWSHTVEEMGIAVRVYERTPGSTLSREVRTPDGKDRKSLGHRDQKLALEQARALARRLSELKHAGHVGPLTLGQLISLNELHRLPLLSAVRQRVVRSQAKLLLKHFGGAFNVEDLSQHAIDGYVHARSTGALKSARHRLPEPGVRPDTIRNELLSLSAMLRWARQYRTGGRRLLTVNPMEGLRLPREVNVKRPVSTESRYQATLAVAYRVDPSGRFRTILVIARHTGRRINAICQLSASDVLRTPDAIKRALGAAGMDLGHADHWPHGAIRWSARNDKKGFEFIAPIAADVRAALDDYLSKSPRVGDVPLFPSTGDPNKAVRKMQASYWLRRAEELAGLPKLERGAWHSFRRLWASERRHLPAGDVAAAGGWRSTEVMRASYQQADAASVYSVIARIPTTPPATPTPTRRARGTGG